MAKDERVLRPSNRGARTRQSEPLDERAEFVGGKIRELRKAREVTLAKLASQTGLSVGYLSQVERNLSSPSIKALHDISRALGVSISWFFESAGPELAEERGIIVRAHRRRKLTFSSGIIDELLSPSLSGDLELLYSHFTPGSSSGDQPYTHRGEEAGVVIAGELELWLDDRHFRLNAGDSFGFPSTTPHRYRNPGRQEAVVIWAITPPSY